MLGNVYQFSARTGLETENRVLKVELESAENELAVIRKVAAKQAARPAARPRRSVAKSPHPAVDAGVMGAPDERSGKPSPERVEQVREKVRDRALERIFVVIEKTGQQAGWDGQVIAEAQGIIEEQFLANGELREQARSGEIDAETARAEVERMRETAASQLDALLGVEAHTMLRERIRGPGR